LINTVTARYPSSHAVKPAG